MTLGFDCSRALTSVIIYVLPIHHIWKLEMQRKKKLQLVGMFSLGTISCGAGIARVWLFVRKKDTISRLKAYHLAV